MNKSDKNSAAYIKELEDKIIDLNFRLKNTTRELSSEGETHRQIFRKLVHNLKNPVGVIHSFSEIMLEDLESYTTEKLTKHLQIIKNSADFSIQLLNNIAKFIRLRSPDTHFIFSNKNYIEIVDTILNEFNDEKLKTNISIKRVFPKNAVF